MSFTTSGLYDIDGDGKPEVVRVSGQNLDVYQLVGGALPGKPEAGRLVQVENGFGAKTIIGYRSAKEDGTTPHQVPFPEIVVTSVETIGTEGSRRVALGDPLCLRRRRAHLRLRARCLHAPRRTGGPWSCAW